MLSGFPVTNWQQTFMYSVFHCQNILRDFIKRGLLRYRRTAEGSFEPCLCVPAADVRIACPVWLYANSYHPLPACCEEHNQIRHARAGITGLHKQNTHTAAQRHTEPCSVNAQVEFSCLILFSNLVPHLAGYGTTMRELFTVLRFYRLFAFASHSQHQHDASDGIHLSETWSMRIWGDLGW